MVRTSWPFITQLVMLHVLFTPYWSVSFNLASMIEYKHPQIALPHLSSSAHSPIIPLITRSHNLPNLVNRVGNRILLEAFKSEDY